MNYYPVTFSSLLTALRHGWKTIIIVTCLFAVLGLAAGYAFSGREEALPNGYAEPLSSLSFDLILRDDSYYGTCWSDLNTAYTRLSTYITTLKNDNSISDAQAMALHEAQEKLQYFSEQRLQSLAAMRNEPNVLYIPKERLEEKLLSYQRDLESVRLRLISAQAAAEIVKEMNAPVISTDEVNAAYHALLQEAAAYGSLLKQQEIDKIYIDRLENEMDEVREEITRYDIALNSAMKELNALQTELFAVADQICQDNALILMQDPTQSGKFSPGVNHAHTASSATEAFQIIVIFTTLTGICFGSFLAVCRQLRKESEATSASP